MHEKAEKIWGETLGRLVCVDKNVKPVVVYGCFCLEVCKEVPVVPSKLFGQEKKLLLFLFILDLHCTSIGGRGGGSAIPPFNKQAPPNMCVGGGGGRFVLA